jgi:hypothetical protein
MQATNRIITSYELLLIRSWGASFRKGVDAGAALLTRLETGAASKLYGSTTLLRTIRWRGGEGGG